MLHGYALTVTLHLHKVQKTTDSRKEIIMSLRINDEAPNFTAKTTQGDINFHAWIGDQWAVLFSHPKDFTPVCTTELGSLASMKDDFDKRNVKVIGLSVDALIFGTSPYKINI